MTDSILRSYQFYTHTAMVPFPAPVIPATFSDLLIDDETEGFAIDATDASATPAGYVSVKDTGTPANDLSNVGLDASNLTQTGTSAKMVNWETTPYVRWSPHNMFLNSGTPATQSVTLVTGIVYTISVTGAGGGNITGSGDASGTATTGSPATFTATGTSGTFTLTGSLATMQLNKGSVATPYLATTASIRIGIPQTWDQPNSKYAVWTEPAATNLQTQSENLSTGVGVFQASVSANATTAPDGSSTADKMVEDGTSNEHIAIGSSQSVTNGTVYTTSAYFKAAENNYAAFQMYDFTRDRLTVLIDLANGTIVTTRTIGTFTNQATSITSVGNGWYRVSLTMTLDSGGDVGFSIYTADSASPSWNATDGPQYAGDSASGHYVWGRQFEAGSVATSYIPTLAPTATRARDIITAAISTIPYDTATGTMYVDSRTIGTTTAIPCGFTDEVDDFWTVFSISPTWTADSFVGAASQVNITTAATANARMQASFAAAANDFDVSFDGATTVSDTSGTFVSGITNFALGRNETATGMSMIYRIVYVPRHVQTDDGNLDTWRYNF